MLSNGLKNWQQENSFRVGGDAVYGVHNGVGFSVVDEDGGKLFTFMLSGSDSAFDNCEDLLMEQRGALKEVQVGDVESYLALFFDESNGDMPSGLMSALLDFVAENYRTCGFRAPNVCVKCGAPATKRTFENNMVQPMCAACREAQKSGGASARPAAPRREAEQYEDRRPAQREPERRNDADTLVPKHSSYDPEYDEYAEFDRSRPPRRRDADDYDYDDRDRRPQRRQPDYDEYDVPAPSENGGNGFFGALLGAVAGMVPYFVSALLPFELAALCFVSGICSVIGYIAFDGEKNKSKALGSIIGLSLVISLLSIITVGVFMKYDTSFANTLSTLFSDIWLNLVLGLFGSLLGVAVSYDRLLQYSRS